MMRLGILGTGNMGGAILRGALAKDAISPENVTLFDVDTHKLESTAASCGVRMAHTLEELADQSDMLLLAVKPAVCAGIFSAHREAFCGKAVLSIIAGWSGERLADALPKNTRILRVMPNTPAMVGEGMILLENGSSFTDEERAFAVSLLSAIGKVDAVDAYLMSAVTGVSGRGPAYVYMFIDAMAAGGVQAGLPRDLAIRLAAQTVLGSAKMVLDTGMHPDVLKDMVCSPAGTTIDAVASLERSGFRSAVIDAVKVCVDKSDRMSK